MEWSEVKPVLDATYKLLNERERVSQDAVCAALDRPAKDQQTIRALALLYESGYISGMTVDQSPAPIFITATEKGMQQTSGWPSASSDQVDLLLRLLDDRIADAATPEEEKGRLRRARDAFAALGRDVAVGVLSAYAAQATGANG